MASQVHTRPTQHLREVGKAGVVVVVVVVVVVMTPSSGAVVIDVYLSAVVFGVCAPSDCVRGACLFPTKKNILHIFSSCIFYTKASTRRIRTERTG